MKNLTDKEIEEIYDICSHCRKLELAHKTVTQLPLQLMEMTELDEGVVMSLIAGNTPGRALRKILAVIQDRSKLPGVPIVSESQREAQLVEMVAQPARRKKALKLAKGDIDA